MRHRQNSGAGPSGVRPSIFVFVLLSASTVPAVLLRDPVGPWIAYASAALGASVGVGTLWTQRGLMERRAEDMARRRRADLASAGESEEKHRLELERVRAELEQEQQYTAVVRDQLNRLRTAAEQERQLRIVAERQVDTVTEALAAAGASLPGDLLDNPQGQFVATWKPVEQPIPEAVATPRGSASTPVMPAEIVDETSDDLLYRPFVEMIELAAVGSVVSPAALAMAPVLDLSGEGDDEGGVLDLTAYDQTVEFSVQGLRRNSA
jgi:hypothetical protein